VRQRFANKSDLLEAFKKVTLRNGPEAKMSFYGNIRNSKEKASFKNKKTEMKKEPTRSPQEVEDVTVAAHRIISLPIAQQRC